MANDYFEWLLCQVSIASFVESHQELLTVLYNTPFTWLDICPLDENRAMDGICLRYSYSNANGLILTREQANYVPCSILEMMIGLSRRCEIEIMANPEYGDRTGVWFWSMIRTMGLMDFRDSCFDILEVQSILNRFLNRQYEPDGTGGLFKLGYSNKDLRFVEIWTQAMFWFDEYQML